MSKHPKRYTLRVARTRAGLTQQELGRLAGIAQGMISKLESAHVSDPRFSTVVALARALKVDPETLRFDDAGHGAVILHRIARQQRTGTNKGRQTVTEASS